MNLKNSIIETLVNEVKPAMGCTEPVAVSLATAIATSYLDNEKVENIKVKVSSNIFKNGLGVGIPNTKFIGLDVAAALGCVGGDPSQGLKVLTSINSEDEKRGIELIEQGKVSIEVEETDSKILIIAELRSFNNFVEVTIKDRHDKVVQIKKNNVVVLETNGSTESCVFSAELIYKSSIKDIIKAIESMDYEEISFLKLGIDMNLKVAEEGLRSTMGIGVGYGLQRSVEDGLLSKDIMSQAMILTAAASDARMSGVSMPVMSSNGSGNNGLTAILPIAAYSKGVVVDDEALVKALAISHIINCYIKNQIGRLSALCGCSIAAATGATAALAWLMDCNQEQIEGAMKNMVADVSGTICDGAKLGCALKLSTAASVAVKYALLAKQNCIVPSRNGIIASSIEETINNLGTLSREGMQLTDDVILNIMRQLK